MVLAHRSVERLIEQHVRLRLTVGERDLQLIGHHLNATGSARGAVNVR